MVRRTLLFSLVTVFMITIIISASDAVAADTLARVEINSNLISFHPLIPHSQVRITVTGPDGFQVIRSFSAAETPVIELPGFDGFYKYELRFAPAIDDRTRAALAAARLDGTEPVEAETTSASATVQSGSFTIANGSVVPSIVEPSPEVVLTNADGVIRNSLCTGLDCPDLPAFGDSTMLMMENNARIKFGDTSVGAFPGNDWEIEANSDLSGGANYLGFNDCGTADDDGGCATDLVFAVEAGARQNALYVESDGDVGIGTSNPVLDLHIVTGDTPGLRLDQDGSSGFSPQVWDIAGNETNFFVRDVTNGSKYPFRIRPGATTSAIDISNTGNVGINTASPTDKLHVFDGDLRVQRNTAGTADHAALFLQQSGSATPSAWVIRANASTGSLEIKDAVAAASALKFRSGAANNSIVVGPEAGGEPRVGIGKTTPAGTLDVQGTIFLSGTQVHPDFVFEPTYNLESIDEHAQYMWSNKHLPAVGKGEYDENGMARIELGKQQVGLLEELEKAHIYIDQLYNTLQQQASTIEELQERLLALEVTAKSDSK
jgi:hypothetical protein